MRQIMLFIFSLMISWSAFCVEAPQRSIMEWSGRNPVDGQACSYHVFDISLSEDGRVQFLSQLRFENPFYISPKIWVVRVEEEGDFYQGVSEDGKLVIDLYTILPDANLPAIETVKLNFISGDSPYSLKCSTYE